MKIWRLHKNEKEVVFVNVEAIDYFESYTTGNTWIYLRGGNAVNVTETPEEITRGIKQLFLTE